MDARGVRNTVTVLRSLPYGDHYFDPRENVEMWERDRFILVRPLSELDERDATELDRGMALAGYAYFDASADGVRLYRHLTP
jgi:hypothetical protein